MHGYLSATPEKIPDMEHLRWNKCGPLWNLCQILTALLFPD
jgi:hypothetical protein